LKYKPERRSKIRKVFRRSIIFEQTFVDLNQLDSIQRNGLCLDISDDGLGFTVDVPLKRGEIIKLLIPAYTARTSVPVFSEVIWARPTNDHFRTGLRFLQ
jgi:hypothetical protein